MKKLGWVLFAAVLASNGAYAQSGIKVFEDLAKRHETKAVKPGGIPPKVEPGSKVTTNSTKPMQLPGEPATVTGRVTNAQGQGEAQAKPPIGCVLRPHGPPCAPAATTADVNKDETVQPGNPITSINITLPRNPNASKSWTPLIPKPREGSVSTPARPPKGRPQ